MIDDFILKCDELINSIQHDLDSGLSTSDVNEQYSAEIRKFENRLHMTIDTSLETSLEKRSTETRSTETSIEKYITSLLCYAVKLN
jgi:hypothetical protein